MHEMIYRVLKQFKIPHTNTKFIELLLQKYQNNMDQFQTWTDPNADRVPDWHRPTSSDLNLKPIFISLDLFQCKWSLNKDLSSDKEPWSDCK